MKHKCAKPVAVVLCAALMVGGVGASVYAMHGEQKEAGQTSKQTTSSGTASTAARDTKDETVYVMAGADGSVEKIIVSDWIQNALGSQTITDASALTDVQNVKGEESYTLNGDHMRVWDAQGNDIYYQGNIEKELPVNLSVSYQLDGKSITPAELAGKSGRVTIRFAYRNKQYQTVSIDGKQEKIYVPFAMLTGLLLDNDVFANVTVSNGKLINDGDRTAVIGLAFPGMQSNLNLAAGKVDIPEEVVITADVQHFAMTNTVTIATNEIFNQVDASKLNSLDDLTASMGQLTDAMGQLMDGSSALYDGLCTLLDKSGALIAGVDTLVQGAAQLKAGAGTLDAGAADLAAGAKELADGLGKLDANSASLNAGAQQVFESLLSMADSQLAAAGLNVPKLTIDNYADVLNGLIASLDETNVAKQARAAALAQVTQAVHAQKDTIQSAVTTAVRQQVSGQVTASVRASVQAQVLASMGMTEQSYQAGIANGTVTAEQQAQVKAAVDAQMESTAVQQTIAQQTDVQMQSQQMQQTIAAQTETQMQQLIEQKMNSEEVQAQITAALEQAKSGAASISALKEQLDSYATFYTGLHAYTAGVGSAKQGADALTGGAGQLKQGTAELCEGMNQLYDGILALKDGAPALRDGVSQLKDGQMQLSEGLQEFNEKGVQKLVEAVDGDVSGLFARIKATIDVSKDYKTFSGLSEQMDGQVKFIYRTESIEAE